MTFRLIIAIGTVIVCLAFYPGRPATVTPEQAIARTLVAQIDSFIDFTKQFQTAVRQDQPPSEWQRLFRESRLAYKKFEWAAAYVNPAVARSLNGEPVPEADPIANADAEQNYGPAKFRVVEPEGLQVIEGILYPRYDSSRKQELLDRLGRLQVNAAKYKLYFNNIDLLRGQVFDAARLEVYRILILGISGFDAPLALNSMNEAAAALEGVQTAIAQYGTDIPFTAATAYLRSNPGFNAFDRAMFITVYANPVAEGLARLEEKLHIPVIRYNRLLRQDARTLFDKDAFDADAYAPGPEYLSTGAKIALGKQLFSDPILSGTRTRTCASCHQPDKAFSDGLIRNTVIEGKGLVDRNTPTLLNAALQPAFFYDLRAASLEDQVWTVLHNEKEMQSSAGLAVDRLQQDSTYRRLFAAAFPGPVIDTFQLMNALAVYVRSLVRLDSRFDDYMQGNAGAMNPQEIQGFNLFMGKARCGTCHYMPLFNGVFPPQFDRMETEVIGVPGATAPRSIDDDMGRFAIVGAPFLRHAFKTTTVRNAALTAPYMHNGVFATLDEVMDFYNNGGGAGSGWSVDNQTLPRDSLHLTNDEKKAVIAFIGSLDSR